MLESLRLISQYSRHRLSCANGKGHGVHSPFFYSFIREVLPDTGTLTTHALPERYRAELLLDKTTFQRTDLGGGSRKPLSAHSVRSVAQRSLQPAKWSRLLYRILQYYRPGPVLELGTSFGVTTEYLALAAPVESVYTLEGDPFIARRAEQRFRADGLTRIRTVVGDFDSTLHVLLSEIGQLGLTWLDGNHREEPTLRYVEQLLPYCSNHSILVLDDIYWSRGMQRAWESIRKHPRVRATIDLFQIGIVLFREEFREPIHLRLHY